MIALIICAAALALLALHIKHGLGEAEEYERNRSPISASPQKRTAKPPQFEWEQGLKLLLSLALIIPLVWFFLGYFVETNPEFIKSYYQDQPFFIRISFWVALVCITVGFVHKLLKRRADQRPTSRSGTIMALLAIIAVFTLVAASAVREIRKGSNAPLITIHESSRPRPQPIRVWRYEQAKLDSKTRKPIENAKAIDIRMTKFTKPFEDWIWDTAFLDKTTGRKLWVAHVSFPPSYTNGKWEITWSGGIHAGTWEGTWSPDHTTFNGISRQPSNDRGPGQLWEFTIRAPEGLTQSALAR